MLMLNNPPDILAINETRLDESINDNEVGFYQAITYIISKQTKKQVYKNIRT